MFTKADKAIVGILLPIILASFFNYLESVGVHFDDTLKVSIMGLLTGGGVFAMPNKKS